MRSIYPGIASKPGSSSFFVLKDIRGRYWIPALAPKEIPLGCAGMTAMERVYPSIHSFLGSEVYC
jgi:hypothetical protein